MAVLGDLYEHVCNAVLGQPDRGGFATRHALESDRYLVGTEQGPCDHLAPLCLIELVPITEQGLEPAQNEGGAFSQIVLDVGRWMHLAPPVR